MALPCPRCPSAALTERSVVPSGGGASVNVHVCEGGCKGVWLDGATLTTICPTVAHLPEHRDEIALAGHPGAGIAACPRCRQTPYQLDVLDVPIDFCLQCQGVWLDGDEYEESMLGEGAAHPAAARGGAYRTAGNRATHGEVKCVDCGEPTPFDQTFMREHGHTCRACNTKREITATQSRIKESPTWLEAVVMIVGETLGRDNRFR